MKRFTLILSVMFIWGCSQANDQADVQDAVKTEVTNQVEAVKAEVQTAVETAVETAVDETVADVVDATTAVKSATEFQAGINYSVINPAWETGSDDQVIVYEFFGYLCPHCASFEPYISKLKNELPAHAKVVRVPVVFYPQWKPFAQAYYTFEAMGIADKAHEGFFAAIHQYKKQFRSIEEIAEWTASSFNVDKDEFLSTANSFMIDGQIRKGTQMMQAMGVTSTPTLVTNGKYLPNAKSFKTREEILDVTKYLVSLEAEDMGLAK